MFLKALIYWPLLAVAIVAILCRLIHKAKVADRADDDSDRRAAWING
ncbi:hypothetical protein [Pseudomonas izuensis]|nr:hypothetical protein [Pseudomonas izuensis]